MQCRGNLKDIVLAIAVILGLAPLIVAVDAQAQIAFVSDRDGNFEIYVMDADGGNQRNLTNNPHHDWGPAWLNSLFSVSPVGEQFTMWGWLKQGVQ